MKYTRGEITNSIDRIGRIIEKTVIVKDWVNAQKCRQDAERLKKKAEELEA